MADTSSQYTVSIIGAGVAGPVLALTILSNPTLRSLYNPILYDRLRCPETSEPAPDEVVGLLMQLEQPVR